ncbi:lysM domain receptor-like kinase 4 [Lactuca sativa]|uniref:lysM domain receptor-like kinase 4 n=1 Tax=Lactuca sativa TaxID=4236 RepID=UPI000CD85371|nr:lysM domain receptor-like kinase 4 [Lactuca sativa]
MADSFTFLFTLLLFSLTKPMISQQHYDHTPCNTTIPLLNISTYSCNSADTKTCNTFIIYRPQSNQTLSAIATLFNVNESQLNSTTHFQDREVIVPIICNCPDLSSRSIINYTNFNSYSFPDIACGVYQGLVKPFVLAQQNGNLHGTPLVRVPVKCACVNTSNERNDTRYLVTYPVMENDTLDMIASKFGVTVGSIEEANEMDPPQTIFGGTTLLVPTTGVPVLNLDHAVNDPSSHGIVPVSTGILNRSTRTRFSILFLIVFSTIFLFVVLLFLVFIKWKLSHREPPPVSITRSEFNRCSPDLLSGMLKLKHSLTSFSIDELKLATNDFSESSFIGKSVYKGRITKDYFVAIKDMNSIKSANHVVNILTTINHFNVVKIEGYCFDMDKSYLVFEYTENGSLRDCLRESKTRKHLTWGKRVKIAFDLAEGLHYIHYCTKPMYVHRNISTENVLITTDCRAKISGFDFATPVLYTTEVEGGGGIWPKSVLVGETTVDVYAYGVVLVELLSGKGAAMGRKWLDGVEFVVDGGGSPESLEKFKMFMDGDLEGEYGLGDAMCLALLAKCCIQDDPQYRPTMNDVLKNLSRIL